MLAGKNLTCPTYQFPPGFVDFVRSNRYEYIMQSKGPETKSRTSANPLIALPREPSLGSTRLSLRKLSFVCTFSN
jgi:hypothetical protein